MVANGQTPSRPVTQDDALLAMRDLRDKISTPTRDLFESGAVPAAADTTAGTHTRAVAYRMTAEERVSAQDEAILEVLRDVLASDRTLFGKKMDSAADLFRQIDRDGNGRLEVQTLPPFVVPCNAISRDRGAVTRLRSCTVPLHG